MIDPGSAVAGALASVKTAIDIGKAIRESGISLEKAEGKAKLAEQMEALAEAKIQLADLVDELRARDEHIAFLEEKLKVKGQLEWDAPLYYLRLDDGSRDGPFCQPCMDKAKSLVRLHPLRGDGHWHCKVCDKFSDERRYLEQRVAVAGRVQGSRGPWAG